MLVVQGIKNKVVVDLPFAGLPDKVVADGLVGRVRASPALMTFERDGAVVCTVATPADAAMPLAAAIMVCRLVLRVTRAMVRSLLAAHSVGPTASTVK